MAEKVTHMKLQVDLECEKCYKKVKKLLCKYPQIRDQKYDQKDNIVFITVVCCSPEKIRDKLCCKGGGSIKSIEIIEDPYGCSINSIGIIEKKEKDGDKTKTKPKPPDRPKDQPASAPGSVKRPLLSPPPMAIPVEMCLAPPCYEGRPVGSYNNYGGPVLCYDGYYARPVYDSYGGGGGPYYASRCDQYLSEENATGCTTM